MVKKLFITVLASLVLASCIAQDLSPLPTPILETTEILTETPLGNSTEIAIPTVEQSVTPFPAEKNLKALTDDGKWEISVLLGHNSTIQVRSVDGKVTWILDETTLPDVQLGQLWNYKTSNDKSALFFGLNPYESEDIVLNRWPPSYGLYKLNLASGEVEAILKPHTDSSGFATYGYFALSPDESQIIYSWWDEPSIVVRSITTLEEKSMALPDNNKIAGPFVWSPDGKSAIFTMWSNVWDYPTDFQIARLDIEDESIHSLYSDNEEKKFFVPSEWVQEDVAYLVDRRTDKQWQINPITGKLQERVSTTP